MTKFNIDTASGIYKLFKSEHPDSSLSADVKAYLLSYSKKHEQTPAFYKKFTTLLEKLGDNARKTGRSTVQLKHFPGGREHVFAYTSASKKRSSKKRSAKRSSKKRSAKRSAKKRSAKRSSKKRSVKRSAKKRSLKKRSAKRSSKKRSA